MNPLGFLLDLFLKQGTNLLAMLLARMLHNI